MRIPYPSILHKFLFIIFVFDVYFYIMRQPCTLNIQCRCKLADKSHTEIIKEVFRKFGSPVIAVQICNEILRVTLWTDKAFRAVKLNEDVYLFSLNYIVLSGGPPVTPVHIFRLPI